MPDADTLESERRPSATGALLLLLVLAIVAPLSGKQKNTSLPMRGSIDLAVANSTIDSYMRHVVTTLPKRWREAEEEKLRKDPPRIEAGGIYQIRGPGGTIALEHDEENQRLLCYALIHKLRHEFPYVGLSQQEILTALKIRAAKGGPTGGGELIYEPESNGFYLYKAYLEPPKDARKMAKDLNRLTAAAEKWFRSLYLEAMQSHAETLAPPATATASHEIFRATIVLTPDLRYAKEWDRPHMAPRPFLVTRSQVTRDKEFHVLVLFTGPLAGNNGRAIVEADVSIFYPDGSQVGKTTHLRLWEGPRPRAGNLQIGVTNLSAALDAREPLGRYTVRAEVCDRIMNRCVDLEHPLHLIDG
jgi:hypothetical protein